MNSFSETQAAMRRPTLMTRTSSQGSTSRGSPGGTTGKTRQHRASTSRLHARTPSYGKNLHKLTKIVSDHVEDGISETAKKKVNPPTSPLATTMVRRNTSAVSLSKHAAKAPMRKNKSEVSLLRNTSSTQLHGKKAIAPIRRNGSHGKNLNKTKQHKNTIKFEVEDDEGEWTEESTSPVLTRQSSLSVRSRTQSRLNTPPGLPAEEPGPEPHPSSIDPNTIEADGSERIVPGSPPDLRYDMAMLEELARTQERMRRNDKKTNHDQIMSGNTLLDNNSNYGREDPSPLGLHSLLTTQPSGASRFLGSHQTLIPSVGSSFTRPVLTPDELRSESPDSQLLNDDMHRSASAGNLHKRPLVYFKDSREGAKIDSHTIISNGTIRAGAATQTKLELWRSQGNVEPIDGPPAPLLRGAPIDMLTNEERKTRLWENAEKELYAIRRFSNPVLESAKRASTKDKARPDKNKLHIAADSGNERSTESTTTNGTRPTTPNPRTNIVSTSSAKRALEGPRPPSRAGGRSVRFEVGASPQDMKDSNSPDPVDQILRRLWNSIEVTNVIEG